MALIVGENTYGTVSEATTYFNSRFGTSTFPTLIAGEQENALIMAAILLDSYCDWIGVPTSYDQAMQFPRDGSATIPEKIKSAQFELAEAISVEGSALTEDSMPLRKMKVDVIEFEWNSTSAKGNDAYYNRLVRAYLGPYCESAGGSSNKVIRT
jgi:hypothetical protein